MNETCNIETGLFKKKPCGQAAVTKCATCEQPLCKQHAVAQKKAGVYMCKECDDAQKQYDKDQAKHAKEKRDAEMMKSLANPTSPKPRQPGAPAAAAPAAPAKGAPAKDAPAAGAADHSADPIEYKPAPKPPAAGGGDIPDTIEYRPEPKKK
jgi:hypothetical protein